MFNKEFISAVAFEGMSHTTAEKDVHGHRPAAHLTAKFLTKEEKKIESE